jgi:LPS-assembly lipoprotein
MSSSERLRPVKIARLASLLILVAAAGLAAGGCTVRPLYSNSVSSVGGTASQSLAAINVKPVNTRYGQEVRNQLIFLFTGGSGRSTAPAYDLDLGVVSTVETSATTQTTEVNEPSAATVIIFSNYVLTEVGTGDKIASGSRQISSQFDVPRQEFAALRARRDAENRAARELAELLLLAVGADVARHEGG